MGVTYHGGGRTLCASTAEAVRECARNRPQRGPVGMLGSYAAAAPVVNGVDRITIRPSESGMPDCGAIASVGRSGSATIRVTSAAESGAVTTSIRAHPRRGRLVTAAILLGVGLGGFFDGIVLHQILQWHHLVSTPAPPDTLANLELNTLFDGLFHGATWVVTV